MFFLPRHLLPRKADENESEWVPEHPAEAGAV
jgi:hypothetical protein